MNWHKIRQIVPHHLERTKGGLMEYVGYLADNGGGDGRVDDAVLVSWQLSGIPAGYG